MTTAPLPPESRRGQDDQPDLDQLLLVVLILLADLRDHIRGDNQVSPNELVTRIRAVSAVIRRVRGAMP
jgi:hypothetical protein